MEEAIIALCKKKISFWPSEKEGIEGQLQADATSPRDSNHHAKALRNAVKIKQKRADFLPTTKGLIDRSAYFSAIIIVCISRDM
ncbi:hypothetical protein [Planococcus beigongshangi]|uniref:hypothetical protein n=1 Tax=Planococcus beigongshangi TaxID=2782536 RepID=UPI00193BFBF6|nr:hypothetical protein [Planococcus beigongshangi]